MTFAELFRGYWWLIFPLFGMLMAFWGMITNERRTRHLLELMKSYSDQGKEPPADLVRMVTQGTDEWGAPASPQNRLSDRIWSMVTFLALATGFATAYAFTRNEDWSWVFLMVAVTMAVMACGALLIILLGPKQ